MAAATVTAVSERPEFLAQTRQPCYNIDFQNIALEPAAGLETVGAQGECKYTAPGGVHGMIGNGC